MGLARLRLSEVASVGHVHDDELALRAGIVGLGAGTVDGVRAAVLTTSRWLALDGYLVGPCPQPTWLTPRPPGPNVELPAVPRAGEDLSTRAVLELPGDARPQGAPQPPLAERPSPVRATVP